MKVVQPTSNPWKSKSDEEVWPLTDAQVAYEGRATDWDYDERISKARTGGHMLSGGWVDPSVPLTGPKEAPTMDFVESFTKAVRSQNKWKREKLARRRLFDAEDDSF